MDTARKNRPSIFILVAIAALILTGPLSAIAQALLGAGAALLTGSLLLVICLIAVDYGTRAHRSR